MKWLIVILILSIVLIAGCTQNTSVIQGTMANLPNIMLTTSDVESAGFSVINESIYNISTKDSITKLAKGDESIVKMTENTLGYNLPISGSEERFDIQNGMNSLNGIADRLSVFDTEDNAKLYFSHVKKEQSKDTELTGYSFGDESDLVFTKYNDITEYDLVFRKGNSVVEINVFSKVDAKDDFIKLINIAENKIK